MEYLFGDNMSLTCSHTWGTVLNFQSASVFRSVGHIAGTDRRASPVRSSPASRTRTRFEESSVRRAARTRPAVPPPTMM